jgi:predicted RNA-binding protein (virulence factor B family)
MKLEAGYVVTVTVLRETDIGYMVGDEETEVFMHKNEAAGEIFPEDKIDVFLYHDHKGRLTATMKTPLITAEDFNWVPVKEVKYDLGVFVDIGVSKDMLIDKQDLPSYKKVWPQEGDELYCTLKVTRNGRLLAKMANEDQMKEIAVPATESMFNKNVNGRIYKSLRVGSFIITDEHFLGFIHESEQREEPRIGERVSGRIIGVKEDGSINVSLLPRKHEGMDEDAQTIYDYMEGRGGAMPFWDKSYPGDIKERFNMSKAAFKRALGKLMKEGKVYQEEGWTYFKKDE